VRYLIPEFSGLGDLVQKTPMIRLIRELDLNAEIFLIGDNRWMGLDIVKNSPLIQEIYNIVERLEFELPDKYTNADFNKLYRKIDDKKSRLLREWLCGIEWDVFLDSHLSDVPPVITRLIEQSAAGKIYRHSDINKREYSKFLNFFRNWRKRATIGLVPILKGRHDIDANYDLLEACLGQPFERSYDTWVTLRDDEFLLNRWGLHKKEYVCLQPGAANGALTPKTWHPRNFVELSQKLFESRGMNVVLLGDQGDQEKIISKYDWPETVINTAAKTSIEDLGSLVSNAACVVAHDSGVMHLANAMETPLVALYGPTDYTATRPMGGKSKMLFSKTSAFAIMYNSTKSERQLAENYPNHEAMEGIRVPEVLSAVSNFLLD
jgi:ADP-heptose:LPS heptosyltransferase